MDCVYLLVLGESKEILRLRELSINTSDQEYHLKQSRMDSQVWMIAEKNKDKFQSSRLDHLLC